MRENLWKYVAAVLILLLAAASVAVVLLYMQNSELKAYQPGNVTTTVVVQGPNATCNTTAYQLQLEEMPGLPALYLPELMAYAFGLSRDESGISHHLVEFKK